MIDVEADLLLSGQLAGRDGGLERAHDLTKARRRRDRERDPEIGPEPLGERLRDRVLVLDLLEALEQIVDLAKPLSLLLRAFRGDVGAREAHQRVEVGAHLLAEAAHRAVGPRGVVAGGAEVMEDQEANRLAERFLVDEERRPALHLVEHARADLGVTEEVDLAIGADAARADLPDVVEERGPAHLDAPFRLAHDLLRVLPHVFVTPLPIAETDERFHVRKERVEGPGGEERVEALFGMLAHQHQIEAHPHVVQHRRGGDLEIVPADERDRTIGRPEASARDGAVESVERA